MRYLFALAALAPSAPALAEPVDRSSAIAAIQALPAVAVPPSAPAPSGPIPSIATTWTITATSGVSRSVYIGNLGAGPYSFNQPSLGTLGGTAPNLTYRPSSPGQDSFTVRTGDGKLHAYFVSVFR